MAKKSKYDFDSMDEQLTKRTNESYETKESGGGRTSNLVLPDGIGFWNYKEGTHYVDIIPFFSGKQNPQGKEGDATYLIDYWVHSNVGPSKSTVICPSNTLNYRSTPAHLIDQFGRRCPICEYRNKMLEKGHDPKSKAMQNIKAKRRVAYNVICCDSDKELDKGVQIWEISHFFAERNIAGIAKSERTGGIIPFSSIRKEKGKTIKFENVGKGMNQTYQGFVLEPRDYDIDEEILEQAISIDDFLVFNTYEELKKMFLDSLDQDEEEAVEEETTDEAPARRAGNRPAGSRARDEAFDPEKETPPVRGRRAAPKDEDEDAPEEDEKPTRGRRASKSEPEEEDEDEKPTRGRRAAPKDEDEDSDADEDAAPVRGRRAAPKEEEDDTPPRRRSAPKEEEKKAPVRRRRSDSGD